VEKAIAGYGKKAKDGALALEDMAGGVYRALVELGSAYF
jgi:hypothetical protein